MRYDGLQGMMVTRPSSLVRTLYSGIQVLNAYSLSSVRCARTLVTSSVAHQAGFPGVITQGTLGL